MHTVPPTFVGVAGLMVGLNWFLGRREEVARVEGDKAQEAPDTAEGTDSEEEQS